MYTLNSLGLGTQTEGTYDEIDVDGPSLLQENMDFILQETGDRILIE